MELSIARLDFTVQTRGRRRARAPQGAGSTVADVLSLMGVDPVSYTHLRAHETVLDLVCRLLLEKKK